jgi:hypothetical protein
MSLIVDGIGTPPQPEWFSEYEAPKPIAPWSGRLGDEPLRLGHLGCGRLLAHRGVIAHHSGAHGRMPDQYAEVHVCAAAVQHCHVFGKGLKPPVYAGAQRIEVHALDHRQVAHD